MKTTTNHHHGHQYHPSNINSTLFQTTNVWNGWKNVVIYKKHWMNVNESPLWSNNNGTRYVWRMVMDNVQVQGQVQVEVGEVRFGKRMRNRIMIVIIQQPHRRHHRLKCNKQKWNQRRDWKIQGLVWKYPGSTIGDLSIWKHRRLYPKWEIKTMNEIV